MPILNYTTSITTEKTISEIQSILAKHGANAILQEYDLDGDVACISFKIIVNGREIGYRLPANWQKVEAILKQQRVAPRYRTAQHSKRVAWRIIKDWVASQMAIVEAEQATLDQVMLPYAITEDGRTIYDTISTNKYAMLSEGCN